MKKFFPVLLIALCLLALTLTACGGNKTEAPAVSVSATMEPSPTPSPTPEPTPEPTATPEVTPTPEPVPTPEAADETPANDGDNSSANSNSNSNSNSNANTNSDSNGSANSEPVEEEESIDPRAAAQALVGQSVDELYAAIGQPNSTYYVASCLVIGGDDGTLYYDGFEVDTVRYGDGSESIIGVW